MAKPTRTIGPLHLEDLEPHRFEDLIRQLCYDFKNWVRLEPTGRTGSDDGFDARGIEAVAVIDRGEAETEDDGDGTAFVERTWLVQCKRERKITPKQMGEYMDGLRSTAGEGVHGIIFAAACDFSKATRDVFYAKARGLGFGEAVLWGKGDIEDQLYQPKNDHLLFAYTGISLQMRRRSISASVRANLSAKRKAQRCLHEGQPVLIRDATDERYPYLDPDKKLVHFEQGRWKVYKFVDCGWDGLRFETRDQLAWVNADGTAWDFADVLNSALPFEHEDPWNSEEEDRFAVNRRVHKFRKALTSGEKAQFTNVCVVPYENVIDIDKDGDDVFRGPIVYVTQFQTDNGPFTRFYPRLITASGREVNPDPATRVHIFPKSIRELPTVSADEPFKIDD